MFGNFLVDPQFFYDPQKVFLDPSPQKHNPGTSKSKGSWGGAVNKQCQTPNIISESPRRGKAELFHVECHHWSSFWHRTSLLESCPNLAAFRVTSSSSIHSFRGTKHLSQSCHARFGAVAVKEFWPRSFEKTMVLHVSDIGNRVHGWGVW